MPPKAKAGRQPARTMDALDDKAYKDTLKVLFDSTPVQPRDIDQKVIGLLDALQKSGRVKEAVQFLKTSLQDVQREKVTSWRAYVYSLLRGFDPQVYKSMKEKSNAGRMRAERLQKSSPAEEKDEQDEMSNRPLNASAPEFVPGQVWMNMQGMQAPFPMPMTAMMPPWGFPPQAYPQAQAASGPPPQTAPEMPEPPPPPPAPADEPGKTSEEPTKPEGEKEETKEAS
mmetsp:Transcript_71315/g.133395  ORF Transcript_71315/g.133395 Transcript_71315/m.133395 type:complete len:227 (-) Transcript_71315:210-890(-)